MIDVIKLNFLSQSPSKALQFNQIVYVAESELVDVVVYIHILFQEWGIPSILPNCQPSA